jgi:hypothetical protein
MAPFPLPRRNVYCAQTRLAQAYAEPPGRYVDLKTTGYLIR